MDQIVVLTVCVAFNSFDCPGLLTSSLLRIITLIVPLILCQFFSDDSMISIILSALIVVPILFPSSLRRANQASHSSTAWFSVFGLDSHNWYLSDSRS